MNERNALQKQQGRVVYRKSVMGKGVVVSDNNQRAASGRRAQRNSYALYTMQDPQLQPHSARKIFKRIEEYDLHDEMNHGRVWSIG
jgi:ribosomal protein S17